MTRQSDTGDAPHSPVADGILVWRLPWLDEAAHRLGAALDYIEGLLRQQLIAPRLPA